MTAPTLQITEAEYRQILAFLRGKRRSSEFAASLVSYYERNDHLTDRQWAAAKRMFDDARKPAIVVPQAGLDLSKLPAGHYAVPGGETRLKVCVERPTSGDWKGFIFVKDGAIYGGGANYGNQPPGKFYRGKIQDELRAIMADPYEAMAEYGRITSTCGFPGCGRPLEKAESVARGIGPVCAQKMRAVA